MVQSQSNLLVASITFSGLFMVLLQAVLSKMARSEYISQFQYNSQWLVGVEVEGGAN